MLYVANIVKKHSKLLFKIIILIIVILLISNFNQLKIISQKRIASVYVQSSTDNINDELKLIKANFRVFNVNYSIDDNKQEFECIKTKK